LKLIYLRLLSGKKPPGPQKLSHKFTSNIKPLPHVSISVIILTTGFSLKASSQLHSIKSYDTLPAIHLISVLPQNFYNQHKGYFCKREDQVQKITGLNLFIRLGSKNYVDYLERKPNVIKP
jgi:hypothetical protein